VNENAPVQDVVKYVILRVPYGKYMWWPALQCVDFVPMGTRSPIRAGTLTMKQNTEMGAILVACKHLTTNVLK
jgi:hypothetical protein